MLDLSLPNVLFDRHIDEISAAKVGLLWAELLDQDRALASVLWARVRSS